MSKHFLNCTLQQYIDFLYTTYVTGTQKALIFMNLS